MMEIDLLGGFGEKGRTSVGVRAAGQNILLDVGIKVGATGAEYYPALEGSARGFDAVFISHAHEDHVGGLSWLLSRGFRGRILMTAETRAEAPATLAAYADSGDLRQHPFPYDKIEIFEPGDTLTCGDLKIKTGCSGHVVGGVWFAVHDRNSRLVYAGDVVPDSSVFVMDEIPECDMLILDASYGADPVAGATRASAIAAWIEDHAAGCLLPTPLSGRSLELMAGLRGRFAIHAGMRASLQAQIDARRALLPGMSEALQKRLREAVDWADTDTLPPCPLLADDGMGEAGPSSRLLPLADAAGYPILLTGHLPTGSPADLIYKKGRADWIRMPTHPTLSGNVHIWENAGRPPALGHSSAPSALAELAVHIPSLDPQCLTGQTLTVPARKTT